MNTTDSQISDAISLCKAYWAWESTPASRQGEEPPQDSSAQEKIIISAAASRNLTNKHVQMLLETPLPSSSNVPALLASAFRGAGEGRVALTDCIARFCRSDERGVRINASFSMMSICEQFPPFPRMFRLQTLVSVNLAEPHYRTIMEAAADALVKLCKETQDGDVAIQTLSFFNEQSLLFSTQIEELRTAVAVSVPTFPPAKKVLKRKKMGAPANYPPVDTKVTVSAPPPRRPMSTMRPRVPSYWGTLRIPKERY
jgi:hypothetical protein